jgi:hypothetical protein
MTRGKSKRPGQRAEWVECGYTAKCAAPECGRRASTILRYLDNQGRPDRQIDACDIQARKLSAELNVITGGGAPEPVD